MSSEKQTQIDDELQEEYDFSQMTGGVTGKYAKDYHEMTRMVVLDPDMAKIFPDAKSVNAALRTLVTIVQQHHKAA